MANDCGPESENFQMVETAANRVGAGIVSGSASGEASVVSQLTEALALAATIGSIVRNRTQMGVVWQQLSDGTADSIPLACQDWVNTKAAYRFFANRASCPSTKHPTNKHDSPMERSTWRSSNARPSLLR